MSLENEPKTNPSSFRQSQNPSLITNDEEESYRVGPKGGQKSLFRATRSTLHAPDQKSSPTCFIKSSNLLQDGTKEMKEWYVTIFYKDGDVSFDRCRFFLHVDSRTIHM